MKFISWNVNGLRACVQKGFEESFRTLDADFFCLQETKMQAGQLDLQFEGYSSYWNYADKKGYSGTAIYTRLKPLSVSYGIGEEKDEHNHEGRVITLEMDDFFLVTCYTPNSQDGLRRLDYRMTWEDDFLAYIKTLDVRKPVILCGDLNVAHEEIDLKNPKTNRKNAGFTDEECEDDKVSFRGLCRYVQNASPRRPYLFVVVLPIQGTREERRMAHRLLHRIGATDEPCDRSIHT